LNRGGAAESVLDGKTGILFNDQKQDSIMNAVDEFEKIEGSFNRELIRDRSKNFSRVLFEEKMRKFVREKTDFFHRKK
jgi:hypothetical protein